MFVRKLVADLYGILEWNLLSIRRLPRWLGRRTG